MTLKVGSMLSSCEIYVEYPLFSFFFLFFPIFFSLSKNKNKNHLLYNLKEDIEQSGSDVILLPKGTDSGALQVTCLLLTL